MRLLLYGCFLSLLPCLLAAAAGAVTVTFDVEPTTLAVGEMGTATFTISGLSQAPDPHVPDLDAVRFRPTPSRGQNFSMVNGKTTRSVTFSYQFLAVEEGTHVLAPPPYTADGVTHQMKPVTITVAPRAQDSGAEQLSDLLFARVTMDRTKVYIQEAFDVVLSVYSRNINLGSDFRLLGLPSSGLSFQEFRELRNDRETIDGTVYDVRKFRSKVRALTAGTFTVKPTVRVPVIVKQRQTRRRSIFDLMRDENRAQAVDVIAEPMNIEVLPLPQTGRPSTFSGAVGSFEFEVQAQPLQVQAGEPVTITLQISGRGNLDSVSAPAIDLGPEFKVYEPRLTSKEMNDSQTLGRKLFEQVVIPKSEDITELPPIAFSFFDPATEMYRTLQQGPFSLEVTPSTGTTTRIVQPALPNGDTPPEDLARRDIVYLKKAPRRWSTTGYGAWCLHPVFVGAQALPPLGVLAVVLVMRRRRTLRADVAKARRIRAPRAARAGLDNAASALERKDNAGFYEAVWDTLATYFADRLNLAPGDISEVAVAKAMSEAHMPQDEMAHLRELFMVCEHARFGLSAAGDGGMSDSERRNARLVMEKLDRVIKSAETVGLTT